MSNYFLVNKSGKNIPIYSDMDSKKKVGTLYNREAFGYNRISGGDDVFCEIVFRNSAGKLSRGYINFPPKGALTFCTDYPHGKIVIAGQRYKVFMMRKSRTIYTARGNKWGTVAANKRVACKTAMSGDSHPEWKGINFVENSNGKWVKVTGDGVDYGFVDTGLSLGSGYSSIPMYGSW